MKADDLAVDLLNEMGWDYYNTESSARQVAKYSALKIEQLKLAEEKLNQEITELKRHLSYYADQNQNQ